MYVFMFVFVLVYAYVPYACTYACVYLFLFTHAPASAEPGQIAMNNAEKCSEYATQLAADLKVRLLHA